MAERTEGSIVIEAPPARVMQEIADFEHYTEWSKEIKKAKVVARDPQERGKRVEFTVDAGFAKSDYTLEYEYLSDDGGVTWTTVEASGAIKTMNGEYRLEPDGEGTKVTYRMALEIGIPLPGFLKRRAEKMVIDVALKGLKKRVESQS